MTVSRLSRLLLGLIGAEIQASRTPAMHEREARECGLPCLYQLIDLARLGLGAADLPELLLAAERMGFAGLNITHPCKQAVLPCLTEVSEDAEALGAVNTVVLRDGRRSGYNTDWPAFVRSFRENLPGAGVERVVQLGAGGAGAATAYGILSLGAAHLSILDVDEERSIALSARLAGVFGVDRVRAADDAAAALERADGLIQATPVGMFGHEGLPLRADLLRPSLWVAEVVYFPLETELLREARRVGCRTLDGGWMAVYQAVEAFRIFTGIEPDADRIRRHFVSMVERG